MTKFAVGGIFMSENKKSPFVLSGRSMIFKIALTGILTAMAVVIKSIIPLSIPIFGGSGLKVGLPGIFTAFPALLLGPLWGGVSSGLCDILSFLVNPSGAYQPLLTLTAVLGGCVKGLVFWVLVRYGAALRKKSVKITAGVLLIALGGFGAAAHISLTGDGITRGYIARQHEIPDFTIIEDGNFSPLSDYIIGLARYSKDTLTVNKVEFDGNELYMPAYAFSLDGYKKAVDDIKSETLTKDAAEEKYRLKIPKIADGLFAQCKNLTDVYFPSTYTDTGVSDKAFDGVTDKVTIHTSNEKIIKYAEEHGIKYVNENYEDKNVLIDRNSEQKGKFRGAVFTFESKFKATLAQDANFISIGLEMFAVAGIVILAFAFFTGKKTSDNPLSGGKIFVSVTLGGLATAIPNVFILQYIVYDWADKSTLLLMIPSVLEELLVRAVQAYIIWLLMKALSKSVLKKQA